MGHEVFTAPALPEVLPPAGLGSTLFSCKDLRFLFEAGVGRERERGRETDSVCVSVVMARSCIGCMSEY